MVYPWQFSPSDLRRSRRLEWIRHHSCNFEKFFRIFFNSLWNTGNRWLTVWRSGNVSRLEVLQFQRCRKLRQEYCQFHWANRKRADYSALSLDTSTTLKIVGKCHCGSFDNVDHLPMTMKTAQNSSQWGNMVSNQSKKSLTENASMSDWRMKSMHTRIAALHGESLIGIIGMCRWSKAARKQ